MPRQGDSTLVEVLLSQKCHFMIPVVPGFSTTVATISVHQRLLFTMDNSRCGRNDFCPLAKWTIVVEHVYIKIIFNDYCSFS